MVESLSPVGSTLDAGARGELLVVVLRRRPTTVEERAAVLRPGREHVEVGIGEGVVRVEPTVHVEVMVTNTSQTYL
jgi:hypothetical protein